MLNVGLMNNNALLTFVSNYKSAMVLNPENYGVSAALAASYASAVDAFAARLFISGSMTTRTKPSLTATQEARATLVKMTRDYIQLSRRKQGQTQAMLETVGIPPYTPRRHRRPDPLPAMYFTKKVVDRNSLLLGVAAPGTTRKKAENAAAVVILTAVSDELPPLSAFVNQGVYTRTTQRIDFNPSLPMGTKVWVTAAWMSARGERAEPATPFSITLQGSGFGIEELKIAA